MAGLGALDCCCPPCRLGLCWMADRPDNASTWRGAGTDRGKTLISACAVGLCVTGRKWPLFPVDRFYRTADREATALTQPEAKQSPPREHEPARVRQRVERLHSPANGTVYTFIYLSRHPLPVSPLSPAAQRAASPSLLLLPPPPSPTPHTPHPSAHSSPLPTLHS